MLLMKLGAVVSAVNENPHYMSFVPQFLRAWKTLFPSIQVIVVVIANEIPEQLRPYQENLRLFPVDPQISTVLAAQCIRLLWPRFVDTNDAVMITDIDMFPLQREYYVKPIEYISNDTVVVYRHGLPQELYMCYVAATPTVWRGMFGSDAHEDILMKWYLEANVWNKDQTELTKSFNAWTGPKRLYTDREIGFRRICRSFLERKPDTNERQLIEDREKMRFLIRSGYFTDYHAISNETHPELNEYLVDSLVGMLDKSKFLPETTYISYLPLVFQALISTNAPVIECGMGFGSTLLLHSTGREVVHYDTNIDWLERFDVPNKYLLDPSSWVETIHMHKSAHPIIFLDQAPGESREKCMEALTSDFDGIIIAHDTEPAADYGYKMRQHFPKFRFVVEVKTHEAWATAMSNNIDITEWAGLTFGNYTISKYTHPFTLVNISAKPIQQTFIYPFLFKK